MKDSNCRGKLNPFKFGLSMAGTAAVFYIGCLMTMLLVPKENAIAFFNSLVHLIDFAPIVREHVSFGQSLFGFVTIAILGWFAGVLIAGFYNLGRRTYRVEG